MQPWYQEPALGENVRTLWRRSHSWRRYHIEKDAEEEFGDFHGRFRKYKWRCQQSLFLLWLNVRKITKFLIKIKFTGVFVRKSVAEDARRMVWRGVWNDCIQRHRSEHLSCTWWYTNNARWPDHQNANDARQPVHQAFRRRNQSQFIF